MCHNSEPIRALECSPAFNEANFGFVNYQDSKGETRPEILMTRDGFTLNAATTNTNENEVIL